MPDEYQLRTASLPSQNFAKLANMNDEQLLARLVSAPRVASRQVNVTQQMRDAPLALMNAIGHSDSWAPTERALFNTRHTLNHIGRLRLATFL